MQTYVVTAPMGVTLSSGKVLLSKDQFRRRATKVAPVSGQTGVYEIKAPVMFKHGEKIGYDGTAGKAIMAMLEDEAAATKKKQEEMKPSASAAKGKGSK